MSSSVRAQREETPPLPLTTGTMRVTQELPMISVELGEALLSEQGKLRCEVLLWQRWVRYLALGTMVLLSIVLGTGLQDALLPLSLIAAAYVGVVLATSWILQHRPGQIAQTWFPSLLLAADTATLAGFVYLTSPPSP